MTHRGDLIDVQSSRPWRLARYWWRLATSPAHRSVALIRSQRPPNLFQPYSDTAPDRYPNLFAFARRELGDGPQLRLLSFGCSTGEEVFSLRRYFPSAEIKGLDINPHNIAACRAHLARSRDPGLSFAVASATTGEAAGSYDAVFCLAVLRHGGLRPGARRCDPLLHFADFEGTVTDFARCLRPGGLLFIAHSNFRFTDSSVAPRFDVVLRRARAANARTPLFDRDNRLMPGVTDDAVAFRKRLADVID